MSLQFADISIHHHEEANADESNGSSSGRKDGKKPWMSHGRTRGKDGNQKETRATNGERVLFQLLQRRGTHYRPTQYKKCLRKLRNPRKLPQNGLFSVVFLPISRLELLDSLFALLNLTKLEQMCQMSGLNGFATYTNLKVSALPKIIKIGFSSINLIYFFTAGPDEV
ncbi:uncharacterized protein LOC111489932 [Cucurbita maxima]|uniref:Uncharacterized protein LOC111489932 n=1 Tax=Cucurbita maxima TaxID=3661 RepID=A0A6J1K1Z4_CUCMA|nr:uncharacterized protein LOC111489932 [Cucurbita maxima]